MDNNVKDIKDKYYNQPLSNPSQNVFSTDSSGNLHIINSNGGNVSISSSMQDSYTTDGTKYVGTDNGDYVNIPYIPYPTTINQTTPITFPILEKDKDNIKSKEDESSIHGHRIVSTLHIRFDEVYIDFVCKECGEVLAHKKLFKLPEKVRNSKCLTRLIRKI